MLNIDFNEIVPEDLWRDTFVTNAKGLSEEEQTEILKSIFPNITSQAARDRIIGSTTLQYATEAGIGSSGFVEGFRDVANRIRGLLNTTDGAAIIGAAAVGATEELSEYARNFTASFDSSQCTQLLAAPRMESLDIIIPAAAGFNYTIPQLYGMSYKELLHNITDKVWTYCYESRYVPECQEQLISWYRGNPDIAGIGMLTVFFVQVAISVVLCKVPLFLYWDRWLKWLRNPERNLTDVLRPELHREGTELCDSGSPRISLSGFLHRLGSREHHHNAVSQFLDNYFDTASLFLISLLVGGWQMITAGSFTEYELDTLLYGCTLIFTCFVPAIAAGVFIKPSRRYFKLFCAFFTSLFYLATVLYVKLKNIAPQLAHRCAPMMSRYPTRPVPLEAFQDQWAIWIVSIMSFTVAMILIATQASLRYLEDSKNYIFARLKVLKLVLLLFMMLLCDFAAFVCLWALLRRRGEARTVAGEEYEDDQWNFGQILALFIWVPAGVDYFYVVLIGAKEAFSSKIPFGYKVVEDVNASIGKQPVERQEEGDSTGVERRNTDNTFVEKELKHVRSKEVEV